MSLFFIAKLLIFAALPARGQEAWPPAIPQVAFRARAILKSGAPLHETAVRGGLQKLAGKDWRGLGAEAARLQVWSRGRQGLSLRLVGERGWVTDSQGDSFDVSGGLASALRHMSQYFEMTGPTMKHPVSFEELEAAALSEEGAAAVRSLFDLMLKRAMDAGGVWIIPEIGGEATLDQTLVFHEIKDASRPLLGEIAAVLSHPDGALPQVSRIARLFESSPLIMSDIDSGVLKYVIKKLPGMEARGVPVATREKLLRLALETALSNSADSWVMEPDQQFSEITGQAWSGRYIGEWHTHSPRFQPDGWGAVEGPSEPDMDNARASGQFLTISFHPEGFDLYDLSGLDGLAQIDRSRVKKISYRSPAWRAHFEKLHQVFMRSK